METEYIQLEHPTSMTIDGPKIYFEPGTLRLEYDAWQENDLVHWTRLSFENVIAHEFRSEECSLTEDLDGYNRLVKYHGSPWLEMMLALLRREIDPESNVPREKFEYKHWRIFFNTIGVLNIVAKSCKIEAIAMSE